MLVGAVQLTESGRIGRALFTDGIDQYVDLGSSLREYCVGDLSFCQKGVTLSLWLKTMDTGEPQQYYISSGAQTTASHGLALLRSMNDLYCRARHPNGKEWSISGGAESWEDGVWAHVMVTWEINEGLFVYVNGSLYASTDFVFQSGAGDAFPHFMIGRRNDEVDGFGKAWYDDIRFYNEVKSQQFASSLAGLNP